MAEIRKATREQAEKLILQGVTYFRVGGAVGFDTLAAETLFELRERFPDIRVSLYDPFDGFTASWSTEQIDVQQTAALLRRGDLCVQEVKAPGLCLPEERQGVLDMLGNP